MSDPLPKLDREQVLSKVHEAEENLRDAKTLIGLEQALRGEGRPAAEVLAELQEKFRVSE